MGYDDDYGFDFEDEQEERQPQGPKALRELVKSLKAKVAELEGENKTLVGKVSERNLTDVLSDKGLRAGLAKTIRSEGVDVTDRTAIEEWLSNPQNQEDYAFSVQADPAEDPAGGDEAPEGEADPIAAEFARMQNAAANALPEGKFNEASAAIDNANDIESMQKALDKAIAGAANS